MNKRFLGILMILVIGFAGAYIVGNTITQEQFDSQSFDDWRDLDPVQLDKYLDVERERVFVNFSYDSLRRELDEDGFETGLWEIVEIDNFVSFHLNEWKSCRLDNNKSICEDIAWSVIKDRAKAKLNSELEWLESQKTKSLDEMFDINGNLFE